MRKLSVLLLGMLLAPAMVLAQAVPADYVFTQVTLDRGVNGYAVVGLYCDPNNANQCAFDGSNNASPDEIFAVNGNQVTGLNAGGFQQSFNSINDAVAQNPSPGVGATLISYGASMATQTVVVAVTTEETITRGAETRNGGNIEQEVTTITVEVSTDVATGNVVSSVETNRVTVTETVRTANIATNTGSAYSPSNSVSEEPTQFVVTHVWLYDTWDVYTFDGVEVPGTRVAHTGTLIEYVTKPDADGQTETELVITPSGTEISRTVDGITATQVVCGAWVNDGVNDVRDCEELSTIRYRVEITQ